MSSLSSDRLDLWIVGLWSCFVSQGWRWLERGKGKTEREYPRHRLSSQRGICYPGPLLQQCTRESVAHCCCLTVIKLKLTALPFLSGVEVGHTFSTQKHLLLMKKGLLNLSYCNFIWSYVWRFHIVSYIHIEVTHDPFMLYLPLHTLAIAIVNSTMAFHVTHPIYLFILFSIFLSHALFVYLLDKKFYWPRAEVCNYIPNTQSGYIIDVVLREGQTVWLCCFLWSQFWGC